MFKIKDKIKYCLHGFNISNAYCLLKQAFRYCRHVLKLVINGLFVLIKTLRFAIKQIVFPWLLIANSRKSFQYIRRYGFRQFFSKCKDKIVAGSTNRQGINLAMLVALLLTLKNNFSPKIVLRNVKLNIFYIKNYGFKSFLLKFRHKVNRNAASKDSIYKLWIKKNEPNEEKLKKQRRTRFRYNPLVSIITSVSNVPKQILIDMIDSVITQTYSNWELCIVDGASGCLYIKEVLDKYAGKDKRIKVKYLKENKGITGNLNEAISLATGDFIGLIDYDNILAPFALFDIVKSVNENPDTEFFYSDEDVLDEKGNRKNPLFKPDWSPETLKSHYYTKNISILKKSLMKKIGGFREDIKGGYQYDMVLRVSEMTHQIVHIPKILCHVVSERFSIIDMKRIVDLTEWDKKVLRDHLQRTAEKGRVENGISPNTYQIIQEPPEVPLVSIIILNRDHLMDLKKCIQSVMRSDYKNFEIIIVENNSSDLSVQEYYKEIVTNYNNVKVIIWKGFFNYSSLNNYAARYARGEILLFLNNDVEVINLDWLSKMLEYAVRKEIGIVGAKLFYSDGRLQHGGIVLNSEACPGHIHRFYEPYNKGYLNQLNVVRNVSAVTGACMMMKREVFQDVQGFDEDFMYNFGDVDICLKAKREGYRNIFTPFAKLYHNEGTTRKNIEPNHVLAKEQHLLSKKWKHEPDPYLNKNLALLPSDEIDNFIKNIFPRDVNQYKFCRTNFFKTFKDVDNFFSYSIIILNKDRPEFIRRCVDCIKKGAGSVKYEIIIGDTGSTNTETLKFYEEVKDICRIVKLPFFNFSKNNNDLARLAKMNFLLFLNNDVFVKQDFLMNMGKYFIFPDVAIVGSKLLYEDGRIQHIGLEFIKSGSYKYLGYHPHRLENDQRNYDLVDDVPSVTGACLMIERDVFNLSGGFDERFISECQDSDLCLRLRRGGYRIICDCSVPAVHLENGTRPKEDKSLEDRRRFTERWKSYLDDEVFTCAEQSTIFVPKVLFIRERERGDVLASTAVVREFKKRFPSTKIDFETKYRELVLTNTSLRKTVINPDYAEYDCIIYLTYEIDNWDGTWLQSLFKCAGFRKNEITCGMQYPVFSLKADRRFVTRIPRKLIVIGANAGWPQKEWSYDSWVELIRLLDRNGYQTAQVGSIKDSYIKGSIDFRGLSFNRLGIIMSQALLFVGIDSFPMHMALALLPIKENMVLLTCPTAKDIHIFTGRALEIRGKFCYPCRKKSGEGLEVLQCQTHAIKSISVDSVYKAIMSLLSISQIHVK